MYIQHRCAKTSRNQVIGLTKPASKQPTQHAQTHATIDWWHAHPG